MHQVSQDSSGTKRLSHCHTSALGNLATEPCASKFDKHMAQPVEAKAHGAGLLCLCLQPEGWWRRWAEGTAAHSTGYT